MEPNLELARTKLTLRYLAENLSLSNAEFLLKVTRENLALSREYGKGRVSLANTDYSGCLG